MVQNDWCQIGKVRFSNLKQTLWPKSFSVWDIRNEIRWNEIPMYVSHEARSFFPLAFLNKLYEFLVMIQVDRMSLLPINFSWKVVELHLKNFYISEKARIC